MKLTRRTFAIFGLGGVAGVVFFRGHFMSFESEILRTIHQQFGPEIGKSEATQDFAKDYARAMSGPNAVVDFGSQMPKIAQAPFSASAREVRDIIHGEIIRSFILTTTAIVAYETGESVDYFGLAARGQGACVNPLGANWHPKIV